MPKPVRVRLAPSPTGEIHIGTIWIGQFAWLFARQNHGQFILRIEDTDQKRFVAGSTERMIEALEWYNIRPDEGPHIGGDYGPYVQSQRLELYRQHAQRLVEQGRAYYCFCSPERLENMRLTQQREKLPPRYDKHCLALPTTEVAERLKRGESSVIRLNVPTSGTMTLHDRIRGQVTFRLANIDDSVLIKSDGFPTYHLAVVVDDHLMEISHVIRAEEWLPSTPKHLLIYDALGWERPEFAHLPLILGADKKKLSKRHGAQSALWFRDQGYVSEAMQNFLLLMGWHPGGDTEILSREQALKLFSLDRVNPSGAIFDQAKLDWLNAWYIRQLPLPELLQRSKAWWVPPPDSSGTEYDVQSLALIRERLIKLSDIPELILFAYTSTWDIAFQQFQTNILQPPRSKHADASAALVWIERVVNSYSQIWESQKLRTYVINEIAAHGKSNMEILWPLRVALTLHRASPDVFDVAGLIGKSETLRRINVIKESTVGH